MKRINIMVFILFLSLFSSHIFAVDWKYITTNKTFKDDYYVDLDSIKKIDGMIFFWDLRDGPAPVVDKYYSSKSYMKVDCDYLRNKPITQFLYIERMGLGKFTELKSTKNEWEYNPPGSVYDIILKFVCKSS